MSRDVIVWANEQAAILRALDFGRLDLESVIAAVKMVGESEKTYFQKKVVALICSFIVVEAGLMVTKAEHRLLQIHRKSIAFDLKTCHSFIRLMYDPEWLDIAWGMAVTEKCLVTAPTKCLWTADEILEKVF